MVPTEKRAIDVLRAALPPDVRVRTAGESTELTYRERREHVDLVWVGAGFPRDVERALARAHGPVTIVAAATFSPGAQRLLVEAGVSWVGGDGPAHIAVGPVLVDRQGAARRTAAASTDWNASQRDVAEAVLARAVESGDMLVGRVEDLGALTNGAYGSIARALARFDKKGWTVRSSARRRKIVDATGLLDAWVQSMRTENVKRRHFSHFQTDPLRVAERADAAMNHDLVFTGGIAEQAAAPFATGVSKAIAYVPVDALAWAEEHLLEAGFEEVDDDAEARFELRGARAATMRTAGLRGGRRVVSPPRVYADLLDGGVRADETAARFRDAVIGF